jgi:hypothetical protein
MCIVLLSHFLYFYSTVFKLLIKRTQKFSIFREEKLFGKFLFIHQIKFYN